MLFLTMLLAALSVVERNGTIQVERDGQPLVRSISVDRGALDGRDVRRSTVVAKDGSKVWNVWSEDEGRKFRLEVAERKDGAVEITMAGHVDGESASRLRFLRLGLATGSLKDASWRSVSSASFRRFNVTSGTFAADSKKMISRFLAVDGVTFDFNPFGVGDYYAAAGEGWRHIDTLIGIWNVTPGPDRVEFSAGEEVLTPWGGYTGAKVVIREGVFEDFDRYHSRRTFHYDDEFKASVANDVAAGGTFRCALGENLQDGFYLVTLIAKNPDGPETPFDVAVNGVEFGGRWSVRKGSQRRVVRVLRPEDGAFGLAVTGTHPGLRVAVQPLLYDQEDFSIRRGPWVSDGYEPDVFNRNCDFADPFEPAEVDETDFLPGRVRPGTEWTKNPKIKRVLDNTASFAEFDKPGSLARYFEKEVDGRGYNVILLSGMLSRHTYRGQLERGLLGVKRFTEEAHRRGYKVIDHFDTTLLWNIGGGFRVLAERLPELAVCTETGLSTSKLCISNPRFREKIYDYAMRDAVDGGVDGLMMDESFFDARICACRYCRERFERATGLKMPAAGDAAWKTDKRFDTAWRKWRIRQATDFIGELRFRLLEKRPDIVFTSYTTTRGTWYPHQSLLFGRDYYDLQRVNDIHGVEVMSRAVMWSARSELPLRRVMGHLTRWFGTSIWNWYYAQDWQSDYTAWAIDELTAQSPMLSEVDRPVGTPDYANFKGMRREGADTAAEIAVLFSMENRNWNTDALTADSTLGLAQNLEVLHVPYDVIGDGQLAAGKLGKYKTVAVPTAAKLSGEQESALAAFVQQGGEVIRFEAAKFRMKGAFEGDPFVYDATEEDERKFRAEIRPWAEKSSPWRVQAPAQVATSLYRESDGAWAVHFLNLTGVHLKAGDIPPMNAPDPAFPPIADDIAFTLPFGARAEATSPDFADARELPVEKVETGIRVTVPKELLKTYLFVRVK